MRKYIEVGKIAMKTQMTYRLDVITGSLMPFIRVFLAYALWRVLYTGKTEFGGMSFGMMLTYYIICAFLQRLEQSNGLVWETAGEIREGRFSKYMVRPISPLGHFLSVSFAKTIYLFTLTLLITGLLALLFKNQFVPPSSLKNVICACVLAILGLVFMALLNYLTALLAFKFNDVTGWHLLKSNIVEFLAGTLIPLSLLPQWLLNGMSFFPFYYIQYIPASLYLGLRTDEALTGIITLAVWNIALWLLAEHTYRRFKNIYEGVGV